MMTMTDLLMNSGHKLRPMSVWPSLLGLWVMCWQLSIIGHGLLVSVCRNLISCKYFFSATKICLHWMLVQMQTLSCFEIILGRPFSR